MFCKDFELPSLGQRQIRNYIIFPGFSMIHKPIIFNLENNNNLFLKTAGMTFCHTRKQIIVV